jgi:hypothetical protein
LALRDEARPLIRPPALSQGGCYANDYWLSQNHKTLAHLTEAQGVFRSGGVTNIRTFVDPDDPTRAAVMMDVPDMDALQAAMQCKAAADAMDFDGVVPESLVILVESKG